MKKFKCTAKDESGRRYAGEFEAIDMEDARQKVLSQGFSIVSLEEIESIQVKYKKARHGLTPLAQRGELQVAEDQQEQDYESGKGPSGDKKLSRTIVLGLSLVIGIPIVLLALSFYVLKQPQDGPEDVVRKYYEYGAAHEDEAQYGVLGKGLKKNRPPDAGTSAGSRATEAAAVSEVKSIVVEKSDHTNAEVRVELLLDGRERKYKFFLRDEWGNWKINLIRDEDDIQNQLKVLAGNARETRKTAAREILKEKYRYAEDEINSLISLEKQSQEDEEVAQLQKEAKVLLDRLKEQGRIDDAEYQRRLGEILQK